MTMALSAHRPRPRRRVGRGLALILFGLPTFVPPLTAPAASAQEISPALPGRLRPRPPRLAALPPLPPPLGVPQLQAQVSCPALQ